MPSRNLANRRLLLRERPRGIAGPEHFTEDAVEARAPGPGEVLLETLYLSVDPAMRVWISEDPGYVPPVPVGTPMRGGGIGRVLESNTDELKTGDLVQGQIGWQSHPTLSAQALARLDPALGEPLDWIGPIGTTGLTAWFGLREVGRVAAGETVLVSAASGAVGQMVGQIGKLEGCRVVGIAGGAEKCAFATGMLGFDAAIDYKAEPDLAAAIRRTCPEGVDVYFDNVGGPTLDAALLNLRLHGRAVICGRISQTAGGKLYGVTNLGVLIGKRARIEGFVVSDYAARFPEARRWLAQALKAGRLRQRLHIIDGLGAAPDGLRMLFRGENQGKLVVRVAGG